MPGFLEDESAFNKKYNKYLTANLRKLSENLEETQAFIEALKSLKKRIQPFILRRTKDDVLKELPPKIIQDYKCPLSTLQTHLQPLMEKQFPITQITQGNAQKKKGDQKQNAMQNLILHRQFCNHPFFVAEQFKNDPEIKKEKKRIKEARHSGKLLGLLDLLTECEICSRQPSTESEESKESREAKEETKHAPKTLS